MKMPHKGTLIYLSFIFFSVVFIVFVIIKSLPPKIDLPQYTIGEFVRITGNTKGSSGVYRYKVDGSSFFLHDAKFTELIIGEKFLIKYDKNEPKKAKIFFDKPMFTENEITETTIGVIKGLSGKWVLSSASVTYVYMLNGIEYERWQFYNWENSNIKLEDKFEVKYLLSNPRRAIMCFDKPIKNK
jgi:hypothetical protein